jgi:ubiquinone/menaquinone biosynthesis C-methylase UbiE
MKKTKADYGIDAPQVIRNFYFLGVLLILSGYFLPRYLGNTAMVSFLSSAVTWWGVAWILTSLFMLIYAKKGKFKHRERMLNMVSWKGNENVLDIGTGRGLLMIGAAKKLTTGKAVGIDIWNSEDLSANGLENTMRNVEIEGVKDKVEVKSEDVRRMSFQESTFDVILSNLCIHNLYKAGERDEACKEIARVLKPGGVALISDFRHIKQYSEKLQELGLKTRIVGSYWLSTFPKLTVLEARK